MHWVFNEFEDIIGTPRMSHFLLEYTVNSFVTYSLKLPFLACHRFWTFFSVWDGDKDDLFHVSCAEARTNGDHYDSFWKPTFIGGRRTKARQNQKVEKAVILILPNSPFSL